jgi:hypothetical protein
VARLVVTLLCGVGLIATAAGAEPYQVGSVLPPLELPDPHGEAHALDASTRVILFSRDMDGGGVIQDALAADGAALLERQHAVYIADVSRMPGLVRRWIAKPRMRARPYRMLIDEEGEATADFPSLPERPTLLFLESRRVVRIEHPATPAELLDVLGESPAP